MWSLWAKLETFCHMHLGKWFLMDWIGSIFASSMQIIIYLWILAQGWNHGARTLFWGHLQEKKTKTKKAMQAKVKGSDKKVTECRTPTSSGSPEALCARQARQVYALCFLQRPVTQEHEQTVNSNPGPFSVCASLFVHFPQLRGRDYRWLAVLCPVDDHRWSDIWHGPDQRGCGQCE